MITGHNFYFFLAIGVFFAVLLAIAGYYYVVARRSSQAGWENLLAKLRWFDRNVIAEVALDGADENRDAPAGRDDGLDPADLWKMIGGMEGLEILEENSKVLIELACYLQRWYPEALPIAEQLRSDSRALQWHVGRLKGAAKTGNLEVSFPFYAQRAVSTYYQMTQRVIALYEAADFALLPELHRAL